MAYSTADMREDASGAVLTYREALNGVLFQEMRRDPTIIVMGEDIAGGAGREDPEMRDAWGGPFQVTKGLLAEFGPARVRDTPITESAFVGAAIGGAAAGIRPIAEVGFIEFVGVCFDQIINQGAKLRYMFGGKAKVPVTIRTTVGAGMAAAAQHSSAFYSILAHFPGLKVALPATPADAKGLLTSAIRDDDPVIVIEHKMLYDLKGPVPDGEYLVPFGKAAIAREGTDVTIVALSRMVHIALEAAEQLAAGGIDAEVIDPRTISPLDEDTILTSVQKTHRLVVVDEDNPRCSMATDIAALAASKAFEHLDAPIGLVTAPHTPVPFSPPMEAFYIPNARRIVEAATEVVPAPAGKPWRHK